MARGPSFSIHTYQQGLTLSCASFSRHFLVPSRCPTPLITEGLELSSDPSPRLVSTPGAWRKDLWMILQPPFGTTKPRPGANTSCGWCTMSVSHRQPSCTTVTSLTPTPTPRAVAMKIRCTFFSTAPCRCSLARHGVERRPSPTFLS
jgi:hypothetical protein